MLPYVLGFIGVALCPALLGGFGAHLTAIAIQERRSRLKWLTLIWGLAIIGVVCVGLQQISVYESDRKHEEKETRLQDSLDEHERKAERDSAATQAAIRAAVESVILEVKGTSANNSEKILTSLTDLSSKLAPNAPPIHITDQQLAGLIDNLISRISKAQFDHDQFLHSPAVRGLNESLNDAYMHLRAGRGDQRRIDEINKRRMEVTQPEEARLLATMTDLVAEAKVIRQLIQSNQKFTGENALTEGKLLDDDVRQLKSNALIDYLQSILKRLKS